MHFNAKLAAASLFAARAVLAADGPVNCEKEKVALVDIAKPPKPACGDYNTGLVWTTEDSSSTYCRPDADGDKNGGHELDGKANAIELILDTALDTWHGFTFDEQRNQRSETILRGSAALQPKHQWQFWPTNVNTRLYVQFENGDFKKWTDIHGKVRDVSECEHKTFTNTEYERWYCIFWREGDPDMPCN